jgi:hypothetical protein
MSPPRTPVRGRSRSPAGFLPAQPVGTLRRPRGIAAPDLDGDGRIDLAVTDADADEVVVLLTASTH